MHVRIAAPGMLYDSEVGLRFRSIVQHNRVLHPKPSLLAKGGRQQAIQEVDRERMARTNGRHVNQLPFQQLDAIVLAQDPGLAQAAIVGHRQPVPGHVITAQDVRQVNIAHRDRLADLPAR